MCLCLCVCVCDCDCVVCGCDCDWVCVYDCVGVCDCDCVTVTVTANLLFFSARGQIRFRVLRGLGEVLLDPAIPKIVAGDEARVVCNKQA